ncbi:hypothetical protein CFOL_v3_23582 [Cephalotus follicularis]|uniref:Uncharacterized protein n=1 Tax=Cephalotus follicularis TaxID=3775 RepID=A0A1Q3CIP1_CEPFO|nr:hypothetical protein CFOL_v3_23582 [Cephalotus follicularis]
MPGRPKSLRRKHPFEEPRVSKLSRVGKVFTCCLCRKTGYNKKGCKNKRSTPMATRDKAKDKVEKNKAKQNGKAKEKCNANHHRPKRRMEGSGIYINPDT